MSATVSARSRAALWCATLASRPSRAATSTVTCARRASALEAGKAGEATSDRPTGLTVEQLVSFGEDACGRVYTVSIQGSVSRLRDGERTRCKLPEAPVKRQRR